MYVQKKLIAIAALTVGCAALPAAAQVNWTGGGATDNWNDGNNWDTGSPPMADPFQDVAVIENGGTPFINTAVPDIGGLGVGFNSGSGTLTIQSGGSLIVRPLAIGGEPITPGGTAIGGTGTGVLTMTGGSLTTGGLTSGGAGSQINLSGGAAILSTDQFGPGLGNPNTGSVSLNAVTDITGQSVTFTADNNLSFGGSSQLRIDVAGASAPQFKAGEAVTLGGALDVNFSGAPAVGSSWNLFDAGDVNGAFAQINATGITIGEGQRLRLREVADESSMNGKFGQLVFEQLLRAEINRDTGAVRIVNPGAAGNVAIDGYSLITANNSFNPANGAWSSLADQGVPGWIEANPKPTVLNELDTDSQTLISGGGQLTLGAPWAPQYTAFGQSREDVTFTYTNEAGEEITGTVVYTGVNVNDLALIVDPSTGAGQLRNASNFSVSIEGYDILSASGALTPATWDSLDDNPALADWLEANPEETGLSELKTEGVEPLFGGRAFNIGNVFEVGGVQDLVFQYYSEGSTEPTLGRVVYGQLPPISPDLPGDKDADGDVDGRDFLLIQRGLGSTYDGADVTEWKNNFGAGAAVAAAAAVPEPAAYSLIAAAACAGVAIRRRRPA